MSQSKRRVVKMLFLVLAILPLALIRATAGDPFKQIIVQCSPHQLEKIRSKFGAAILDAIPEAETYLLAVSSSVKTDEVEKFDATSSKRIRAGENLSLKVPPARRRVRTGNSDGLAFTSLGNSVAYYTSSAPDVYVDQLAAQRIQIRDAHHYSTGRRAVIALIDTGIDESHPVLVNSLLPGHNYVVPSMNPSEYNDPVLSQSQVQVFSLLQSQVQVFSLLQSQVQVFSLAQSQVQVFSLAQSQVQVFALSQSQVQVFSLGNMLPPAFGHGTMTAGLAHLVAPEALLMPMKAFDANGSSTLWNVVRAIRDSVNMGANVINMSFSSLDDPKLLDIAIDYAASRGVAIVAAVGNDNNEIPTSPASVEEVTGIASLNTVDDVKAWFSNYGKYVDLSAPGVDLVTTYPSTFAIGSGTSFSAPLVSGEFALLKELGQSGSSARSSIEKAVDPIDSINPEYRKKLGKGRINVLKAVRD